jgi:hypothetical protein
MKKLLLLAILPILLYGQAEPVKEHKNTNPPIYIAFLWHMHQPIYYPYESIVQTDLLHHFPFSVTGIHTDRTGPYTSWPKDAVLSGINANLPHLGAQVSFTGSLIENLNNLEASGGSFVNWKSSWNTIRTYKTSLNNPRMDLVAFPYFHPLLGLLDSIDIVKQIKMHKQIFQANFPGDYSKGMFPPENAFSEQIIPALVSEGIQWVMVDNIHFDRACANYPYSTSGNIYETNRADITNQDPNDWVQLNNLWAPTKNSARWGRQPHYAVYTNPVTGVQSKIIVVPTDRYLGNEDGRGGFGALQYESVMSQLESFNTDASHPILIVLHHDGDNYGGGSDSYYHSNFQSFVNWLTANPNRFVCTTVQDYLQMYPPSVNDVIHVENGSWAGADNGDPQFKKWLGDPGSDGYSPDINSWGIITAAKNIVAAAEQNSPANPNTINAWKYLLCGEASDYWYWDNSLNGIWDSNPARACNQAIQYAMQVQGPDNTPPTIFMPQRKPYNPGGKEWGIVQTDTLKIWTYVYDKSGLKSVKLKYRFDKDGILPLPGTSNDNYTFAGGSGVTGWNEVTLLGENKISRTDPQPLFKAKEYSAILTGLKDTLVDYYIEAIDSMNNIANSPISHCWAGSYSSTPNPVNGVSWSPLSPTKNDTIKIKVGGVTQGALLHWGINNSGSAWTLPDSAYWPAGTTIFSGAAAAQSPMLGPDTSNTLTIKIGPFNNPRQTVTKMAFVIHYNNNTWDNNNGQDYHISINNSTSVKESEVPLDNYLSQNYPNPFNPSTIISYKIRESNVVTLKIYDILGREIETLVSGYQPAGTYSVKFNAAGLSSGIYFYIIKAGKYSECRKMCLFK